MKHLNMLQHDDAREFTKIVENFLNTHKVLSIKFQRNLYYSLSGSTVLGKEAVESGKELKQSHLAFIVWKDSRRYKRYATR